MDLHSLVVPIAAAAVGTLVALAILRGLRRPPPVAPVATPPRVAAPPPAAVPPEPKQPATLDELAALLRASAAQTRIAWLGSLHERCPACGARDVSRTVSNEMMVECVGGGFRAYDERVRCRCGFELTHHVGSPPPPRFPLLVPPVGARRAIMLGDAAGAFAVVFAGGGAPAIGVSLGDPSPSRSAAARLAIALVSRVWSVDRAAIATEEEVEPLRREAIERASLPGLHVIEVYDPAPGEEPDAHRLAGSGALPTTVEPSSRASQVAAVLPIRVLARPVPEVLPVAIGIETERGPQPLFEAGEPLPCRREVRVPIDPRRVSATWRLFHGLPRRPIGDLSISLPSPGPTSVQVELELTREGLLAARAPAGRLLASRVEPPLAPTPEGEWRARVSGDPTRPWRPESSVLLAFYPSAALPAAIGYLDAANVPRTLGAAGDRLPLTRDLPLAELPCRGADVRFEIVWLDAPAPVSQGTIVTHDVPDPLPDDAAIALTITERGTIEWSVRGEGVEGPGAPSGPPARRFPLLR